MELEPRTHELKTWPEYFEKILSGDKTFEVRLNDRDYKVGDLLILREWDPVWQLGETTPTGSYTGRVLERVVSYIMPADSTFGKMSLRDYWCILGLRDPKAREVVTVIITRSEHERWVGVFNQFPTKEEVAQQFGLQFCSRESDPPWPIPDNDTMRVRIKNGRDELFCTIRQSSPWLVDYHIEFIFHTVIDNAGADQ